jgi:hypothetical protein
MGNVPTHRLYQACSRPRSPLSRYSDVEAIHLVCLLAVCFTRSDSQVPEPSNQYGVGLTDPSLMPYKKNGRHTNDRIDIHIDLHIHSALDK